MARPSRLTRARVKLLDDIGFVWEASRRRLDGSESDSADESESDARKSKTKRKKKRPKVDHKHGMNDAIPVFSEGRRGRMGMDPPAAHGTAMMPPGGPGQDPFAAAQALMAAGQANFGLWAAAASGGAPFMPPSLPPAVAAAAGQGINPAMFYPMSSWGAMMPGGMPFAQVQKMQASMMQASMARQQQMAAAARNTDPPTDSETGADGHDDGGEDSGGERENPAEGLQQEEHVG